MNQTTSKTSGWTNRLALIGLGQTASVRLEPRQTELKRVYEAQAWAELPNHQTIYDS